SPSFSPWPPFPAPPPAPPAPAAPPAKPPAPIPVPPPPPHAENNTERAATRIDTGCVVGLCIVNGARSKCHADRKHALFLLPRGEDYDNGVRPPNALTSAR